jgi:hypothetical protein
MKIWFGYGSEHSANLVIIGEFKNADEAQRSLDLLNEATQIARADEDAGHISAGTVTRQISEAQIDFFKRTSLPLGYGGPEQLLLEFHPRREGNRVVITTEEDEINAILRILLHGGAKMEVYSAHDHTGPYGR